MDGIWGWCGLEMTEEAQRAAQVAMARAMNATPEHLYMGASACLAGQGQLYPVSMHQKGERMAAIFGRPHWLDAQHENMARELGDAAACLSIWDDSGESILDKLAGGFSLVILDRNHCLIAIDRMGIQPLCYASTGKGLVFASSAEAVAAHPSVGKALDPQSLYHYFFFYDIPSPGTVFSKVAKLQPAESLHWSQGQSRKRFYWAQEYTDQAPASFNAMAGDFRAALRNAVGRQIGGQKVGAFLSGGTDSSSVAGMFRELLGEAVSTYSIGFDAAGFDEMEYARIAARHFGLNSHEYYLKPGDILDAIPLIAQAYDEPFANESAVPTYFCAKTAASDGTRIMLSGDGGDEIFGGNARYAKQMVFERYGKVPKALRQHVIEPAVLGFPYGDSLWPVRKARSYIRQVRMPLPDRLESYNFLLRQPIQDALQPELLSSVDVHGPEQLLREAYFRTRGGHPVQRMMHLDLKFTLADNDLRKVSRMTQVAGVEVRYPMLDHDLVAFSGRLPPDYLVKGKHLRWFFKQALQDFLPKEILTKSKHGFGLPFGIWALQDRRLGEKVQANLNQFARREYLKPAYINNLRKEHASGHASYFGKMLWVMVILEEWLSSRGL